MKAIAINGSPRKDWNTATLLANALSGCHAGGAQTELVHLYDYAYQGCRSCFSCKRIGGESYGRCAVRDELSLILERVSQADILLLGSPFYFHTETGEMRSFMERLLFPYVSYTPDHASLFPWKISDSASLYHERQRRGYARVLPRLKRRRLPGHHDPHLRELRGPVVHRYIPVRRLLQVRVHGLGPGSQSQTARGCIP